MKHMRVLDAKKVLLDFLKATLSVPVLSKRPDGALPPDFVVVIDVGGQGRVGRLTVNSGLIVDVYSASDGKAETLAIKVDEAIHSLPTQAEPICAVSGGLPRENPDVDAPSHARRSATYILTSLLKG